MKYAMSFKNVKSALAGLPGELQRIEDSPRLEEGDLRDRLVQYLESGDPFLQALGSGVDHFGSGESTSLDTMTDGEWVWPGAAAFYVSHYGVSPSQEFIEHVVANGGVCPALDHDERRAVGERFRADLAAARAAHPATADAESTLASVQMKVWQLVRDARRLHDEAIAVAPGKPLVDRLEAHATSLGQLLDEIHDALLNEKDRAEGAKPRT